jgi:serine/threonine protein phosphatase PrpC
MGSTAADPARLFLECAMHEGEIHPCASGEAFVFSARTPAEERANEDAAALIPLDAGRCVLAVADGVGGARSGAQAAGSALRHLADALLAARGEADLRGAILDGIERASRAVRELGVGAATTLAVVEIEDARLRPYHVGDSEILLVGQRGRLKLATLSHAPVAYAVEAGLLEARDALHHEDRHLISNAVGAADMRIEVGPSTSFSSRDTLLLGSDGLFDNLHRDEIVTLVRKGPLPEAGRALAARAGERMHAGGSGEPCKPDDLTFLLFRRSRGGRKDAARG